MGTFCSLRDNGCSPLGSFCSFVELYRNSAAVQYTVIEVYRSLFHVTLWKRRHAVASPQSFLIAEYRTVTDFMAPPTEPIILLFRGKTGYFK